MAFFRYNCRCEKEVKRTKQPSGKKSAWLSERISNTLKVTRMRVRHRKAALTGTRQAANLAPGKIERSAEALLVFSSLFPPIVTIE